MSITRFINWLRTGSSPRSESARENTAELNSPSCVRRGRQSNDDPQTDMKNKFRCGISLLFTFRSSSRGNPKGCSPKKPNACPPKKPFWPPEKPMLLWPAEKPKGPEIKPKLVCPLEKPKETLCRNDCGNGNTSEWDIERLEALCGLSATSDDHTLYGDYGLSMDDFDDHLFQDCNPANFDEQRDVNDTSVGPSSIPRPPTFSDNHHVIITTIEKENNYYSGTPNTPTLKYSQNQNDNVFEVESTTNDNGGGQNNNIMITRVLQNEGGDTDYEETNNTMPISSDTSTPARANNRRTKKISISREVLQQHFDMTIYGCCG